MAIPAEKISIDLLAFAYYIPNCQHGSGSVCLVQSIHAGSLLKGKGKKRTRTTNEHNMAIKLPPGATTSRTMGLRVHSSFIRNLTFYERNVAKKGKPAFMVYGFVLLLSKADSPNKLWAIKSDCKATNPTWVTLCNTLGLDPTRGRAIVPALVAQLAERNKLELAKVGDSIEVFSASSADGPPIVYVSSIEKLPIHSLFQYTVQIAWTDSTKDEIAILKKWNYKVVPSKPKADLSGLAAME